MMPILDVGGAGSFIDISVLRSDHRQGQWENFGGGGGVSEIIEEEEDYYSHEVFDNNENNNDNIIRVFKPMASIKEEAEAKEFGHEYGCFEMGVESYRDPFLHNRYARSCLPRDQVHTIAIGTPSS